MTLRGSRLPRAARFHTCATCGQESVAHLPDGQPYPAHRGGQRHRAAEGKRKDDELPQGDEPVIRHG